MRLCLWVSSSNILPAAGSVRDNPAAPIPAGEMHLALVFFSGVDESSVFFSHIVKESQNY